MKFESIKERAKHALISKFDELQVFPTQEAIDFMDAALLRYLQTSHSEIQKLRELGQKIIQLHRAGYGVTPISVQACIQEFKEYVSGLQQHCLKQIEDCDVRNVGQLVALFPGEFPRLKNKALIAEYDENGDWVVLASEDRNIPRPSVRPSF